MDGKTNEEAALELGCPKGTVLSRLAWARQRLRDRLTRRGLTLSAGLLAAALSTRSAAAAIPAVLVGSTLKAALLVAAGKSVAEAVSGSVAALTKGALQTMLWSKINLVAGCVLAVSVLGIGGALALQVGGTKPGSGQQTTAATVPVDPPQKADTPPKPDKSDAPKPEEKRYEFEAREQPWTKVFEWYSDISGLPFAGSSKPMGTLTFIPPKGKKFTLMEITDILNEALLSQKDKYILIRRAASFTVLPADEKVDPTFVPRVGLDDLDKRGKYELVSVVLSLTNLQAKEIAPDIRKMMGPFGDVTILEKSNQLVMQETAGHLRVLRQTIKDMEARAAEKKPDGKSK